MMMTGTIIHHLGTMVVILVMVMAIRVMDIVHLMVMVLLMAMVHLMVMVLLMAMVLIPMAHPPLPRQPSLLLQRPIHPPNKTDL